MWSLRILSGPQAGQQFDLKLGRNIVGRSSSCDVKLTTAGVSKEHAEIHVYQDKILVVDLRSSNGTFLNGVKVQNASIRLGDKISVHDVIFDIVPAISANANAPKPNFSNGNLAVKLNPNPQYQPQHSPQMQSQPNQMPAQMHGQIQSHHQFQGAPSPHLQQVPMGMPAGPHIAQMPEGMPAPAQAPQSLGEKITDFVDTNIMPGIFKLSEIVDFKTVLMMFLGAFIFTVTLLSLIPMIAITKGSIMQEARRRAQSLARTVALANQTALATGNSSSLAVGTVETEDGVKQVVIVQHSDGMILAPASRAGVVSDLTFVHKARKESRAQVAEIDINTIGASFPIGQFNPNTGEPEVKAHAIVIYDVSSLNFDDGRAISLFMQTLIIATLVGGLIFYFMWRLIDQPVRSLNRQLDIAMREKRDNLEMPTQFPALQALTGNISSLLTRYISSAASSSSGGIGAAINKNAEAESVAGMFGFPALAVSGQGKIIFANNGFEQLARTSNLTNQTMQAIPDISLQQNLEGLIAKSRENISHVQTDHLEFGGHNCILSCQAVASTPNEVDYFIITIAPEGGG